MSAKLPGLVIVALVLAACGKPAPPATESAPGASPAAAPGGVAAAASAPAAAAPQASAAPTGGGAFADRSGQLVNPDESSMVLLYYDLAGIPLPIDRWVEADSRVQFAPAIDKAGQRAAVKAELEAAAAAVRGVGVLRVTLGANLSDYDPSYGEFTVQALAPSSVVTYSALGQKVEVGFDNGLTAQTWKVPAAEAQAVRDRIGPIRNVSADVLLRITGVQPGPGGGRISTVVADYELRNNQDGTTLARVRVPQQ